MARKIKCPKCSSARYVMGHPDHANICRKCRYSFSDDEAYM